MSNRAAWIPEAKARLEVSDAPYPKPGPGEVVIKAGAVAINPVDWKIQDTGFYIQNYPNVLGEDAAGEVAEVGEGVTKFKVGQRVLGHPLGLATGQASGGGFQNYIVIPEIVVAPIPDSLSFESAAVLPLSLNTAAAGLYQPGYLELPFPSTEKTGSKKTVVVWGGSSSVGSSAIQLAVASGATVVTTASRKNHDYVKSLGAEMVFDHSVPSVADDIVKVLQGTDFAGVYDAISLEPTIKASVSICEKLGGMVATVLPPPEGLSVKAAGVFAPSVATQHKQVGEAIWAKFLPQALASGQFQAKPDPKVVGHGLEKVQDGVDELRKGVSATKLVVTL